MGGGGTTNTIQQSDPWAGQQEFLRQLFSGAQQQFQAGPIPFFGESGTAPPRPTAPTQSQFTNTSLQPGAPIVMQTGRGGTSTRPGVPQSVSTFDKAGFDKANAKFATDQAAYDQYLQSLQDPSTVKTLAPVAPETQQAQQLALGAVPGLQQLGTSALGAAQFGLSAPDIQQNPFFERNVAGAIRPMVQAFTDPGGILNNVRDEFGSAGQYGGTRHQLATGTAAGRLADTLGDTTARLGSDAYTAGLDAQSRALALLPQTQGALLAPAQALDAVGLQKRQQEQDFINEAIRRYNYTAEAPNQNLTQFSDLIRGNFGGTARTSAEVPGTSNFNAALGGAALGASAASAGLMGAGMSTGWGAAIGAVAMLLMNQ